VVKALAPLSAADSTLLKELLPTEARLDKTVGATPSGGAAWQRGCMAGHGLATSPGLRTGGE